MRKIIRIIIHCSDSDYSAHDDISVIREWHTSPDPNDPSKPWRDVGYHFFIQRSGNVQDGRPVEEIGAHAYPWNRQSIGICVHGRDTFYPPQFHALAHLVSELQIEFGIPDHMVIGHCSVPGTEKTCPNFDVEEWKEVYLSLYENEEF